MFLVFFEYFCKAKVKNEGSYGSVTFPIIPKNPWHCHPSKLDLTSAPLSRTMLSPFWRTPFKIFSIKMTQQMHNKCNNCKMFLIPYMSVHCWLKLVNEYLRIIITIILTLGWFMTLSVN